MDYSDVFKKACLIQLSTSIWQGTRMLEPSIMERLGSDWLKGQKLLVNPELLGPIKTAAHQARNTVCKFSLPFPITSLYLTPKESLTIIDGELQNFKDRFYHKVDEFCGVYKDARDEAKGILGTLFNEADYPVNIREKFRFQWRYLVLEVPGKSKILTPEIYEREKQKFQEMMDETRELAMTALREEFGEIVHGLVGQLNGTAPKTLKSTMFNKLREFIDELETRNIFSDEKLSELAQQAKSVIAGVSPYGLKYHGTVQNKVKDEMNILKSAIDQAIEDLPKRRIRMAV